MVFRFDDYELDLDQVELRLGGERQPVEPQVFDVLSFLVRQRHRMVAKEELLDEVWSTRFVTESALSSRIKSARKVIGDDGRSQRLIRTVHGRGYQFVGTVVEVASTVAADAAAPPPDEPATEPGPASGPVDPGLKGATPVPLPATPTIGRDDAIADIADLLGRARIVTLLGPGGVGKTRLASEVALALGGETCFVDLTRVREADLVPATIARELGLHRVEADHAVPALEEALRGREVLLVLDNFEHVIEAAGTAAELVRRSAGVRVLATSRARLRVAGEQVVDVEPLPVRPRGNASGLDHGLDHGATGNGANVRHDGSRGVASREAADGDPADAVALFAQAATAVDPGFDLDRHLPDVLTICSTVDGLPLAIELAASHVRTLPPALLRTRLGARLGSPSSGARDAPARQQTITATIDWSLQLLGEPERRLFARLGMFSGPVPLDYIEAVGADDEGGDTTEVVEVLARLIDQSLVRRTENAKGEPRFVLLELLRERARQLLAEDEVEEVARRHAVHTVEVVEDLEERRWTDAAATWVGSIKEMLGEVRSAWAWANDRDELVLATRIIACLGNFWHREGHQAEARRWSRAALDAIAAGRLDDDPLLVARLRLSAGFVVVRDDEDHARKLLGTAAEDFERLGNLRYQSYALCMLSAAYIGDLDRHDEAMAIIDRAVELARQVDEKPLVTSCLNMRGEITRVHGDDDQAAVDYQEAVSLARGYGDDEQTSMLLGCLSFIADHRGDHASAHSLASEALRLAWTTGNRFLVDHVIAQISGPELGLGRPERSARLVGASDESLRLKGLELHPGDRSERDRVVDGLRAVLGDDTYSQLHSAGTRLSLAEAVELALSPASSAG